MHITLIWAMADNRVIGRDNDLPWDLPKDMQHFVRTTRGKPVIMGRKNFISMPRALPGRMNIVITRDNQWQGEQAHVVHDLPSAIELATERSQADGHDEVMVIGGAEIYALALPLATRFHITRVHARPEGDVFFPEFDLSRWHRVRAQEFPADQDHAIPFTVEYYELACANSPA